MEGQVANLTMNHVFSLHDTIFPWPEKPISF